MVVLVAVNALGAVPASTTATTKPVEQIQKWFDDLADTDPAVREEARFELMGLKREDLNALRTTVANAVPLAPAQLAVLRDIVMHVYLADSGYQAHEKRGFLGAYLNDLMPVAANPQEQRDEHDEKPVAGVIIREPMQGFCAYRYLRAGDIVLGVVGQDFYPTQMLTDLQMRVAETMPGKSITLLLLRNGKKMRVSIAVDAQPVAAMQQQMDEFRNARSQSAEGYWDMTFAPLLEPANPGVSKAEPADGAALPIECQASRIALTHGFAG